MRVVRTDIPGPVILRENACIEGDVRGDLTIPSGVRVVLKGDVLGGVLLCAGAFADIRGVVQGTLHNEGGAYALSGSIGALKSTRSKRYA